MPRFTKKSTSTATRTKRYEVDHDKAVDYCAALERRVDHVARYRMHEEDEALWRLERYTLEELKLVGQGVDPRQWPSFTSNSPRTYWNAIRRATTSHTPLLRVQLPGMPMEQGDDFELYKAMLDETSRHERFGYGVLHSIDEQAVKRGMRPFQDNLAWHLAIRGGVFIRPWFDPDARNNFRVDLWDPRTVSYEPGEDGLDYVCHHYSEPEYSVLQRYYVTDEDQKRKLKPDEAGNIDIYDIWWCEYDDKGKEHIWSIVVAAGGCVLQEAYEHRDMDHVPVFLVRTFGPDIESIPEHKNITRTVEGSWETIYTANKSIYPWINRITTLYALYLRNSAIGPWHARGTDANEEQLRKALQPFQIVQSRRADATIQPLTPPAMAGEVKEFFQYLQGAEQRGSVPYSVLGQIPFELSGFAVNQLQGAVAIPAGEVTKSMGWVYRLAIDELIQQFRQRAKNGRVTVKGMDSRKAQFIEDIKRSELRDKYFLDVKIAPELPSDQLQMANVAKMLSDMGIDPITIMDEYLNIENPREVLQRMGIWQMFQAEVQQKIAAQQQQGSGVAPNVASPEVMGQTEQHNQFQPGPQHIGNEQRLALGMGQ